MKQRIKTEKHTSYIGNNKNNQKFLIQINENANDDNKVDGKFQPEVKMQFISLLQCRQVQQS